MVFPKWCLLTSLSDAGPGPEEEQDVFIDVDCRHPEAVLAPMPAGLSQQQVGAPKSCGFVPVHLWEACRTLTLGESR